MERLLWRGTILLLRLFGDFPPVFLFGSKISAHSTKQAPLFLELAAGTGQHRPFHVLRCAFPHPLQNRVPRSAGHLWRSAAPVSAPASASAGRFPLGSGTRGSRRDQVLLSLPQNRRKHGFSPVSFLHVLHGYVVRVGLKSGFSHLVLSVPNRSHPLHHPKRTRLRLFGLCRMRFVFLSSFDSRNSPHLSIIPGP